jgi:hypothetical protein
MTPAQLAERATLGTLLADPRQLSTVAGWLRPSDFAHWWHTEVYRALLADPGLARRGDPAATAQHVRAALVDAVGHRRADPPGLHTLMRTAPARPVPARYGAMVLEASIRRQVAGLAVHLQAAAVPDHAASYATSTDDAVAGARSLRDVSGVVEPVLADLGAQWAAAVTATGQPAPREPVPGPGDVVAGGAFGGVVDVAADARRTDRQRDLAVVADRAVRSAPPSAPADARADTAWLVAALVAHPDRVDTVAGWLRPEAVSGPARAVYEALLGLHQERVPIDPITVCWEVHRGSRARGLGPDPAELLRQVETAELLDVDALIRTVAHHTLQRTAGSAADGMRAAAANPGLTVGDVLDAAAWAAQAVTRAAHDLRAAGDTRGNRDRQVRAGPAPAIAASEGRADQARRSTGLRWHQARHLNPVDTAPDLRIIR